MQAQGWHEWADEKRERCCFGMNGLGLTHTFGHSIPKASLPLLCCKGTVEWEAHMTTGVMSEIDQGADFGRSFSIH